MSLTLRSSGYIDGPTRAGNYGLRSVRPGEFRILSEGMTSFMLHPEDVRMFGAGRQVELWVLLLFGCCRRPGSLASKKSSRHE